MHTTTVRGLAALLVFVAAASSVRAGPEDDKVSQLQDLANKLSQIQIKQDILITSMQNDIGQLKADVNRLNEEVRRLSPVKTNISASINPEVAPPATGTLILTNHYSYPATFIVNGRSIPVPPSQVARVLLPVGRFNFSVYTDNDGLVYAPVDRNLTAGRTFPITLNP
jgi:HAMP domain-containing protein